MQTIWANKEIEVTKYRWILIDSCEAPVVSKYTYLSQDEAKQEALIYAENNQSPYTKKRVEILECKEILNEEIVWATK